GPRRICVQCRDTQECCSRNRSALAEIRPFAFSPFHMRGEARLDVSRVLAPLDRGQIYCTRGSKRPTAYPERGGVVLIHPRDLCIQKYLEKGRVLSRGLRQFPAPGKKEEDKNQKTLVPKLREPKKKKWRRTPRRKSRQSRRSNRNHQYH